MKKCKCLTCGENREVNFYPYNRSRCKGCISKRVTAYQVAHPEETKEAHARTRAKLGYKEKQAKFYKEWYAKNGRNRADNYMEGILEWGQEHPDRLRASWLLRYAVKIGKVIKPLLCEGCGRKTKLSGHHEDYSDPLKVTWICSSCHKKIHLGIIGLDKRDFKEYASKYKGA